MFDGLTHIIYIKKQQENKQCPTKINPWTRTTELRLPSACGSDQKGEEGLCEYH